MNYVMINDHKYEVNTFYTDSNGDRLVMYIPTLESVADFEDDVKNNTGITSYNDENEQTGIYTGYDSFATLEKQFNKDDNTSQWYVIIDRSNMQKAIDQLSQKVLELEKQIKELQPMTVEDNDSDLPSDE